MELNELTALSPLDGRYRKQAEPLADYFSEYALIKYRVKVEVLYFMELYRIPLPQMHELDHHTLPKIYEIQQHFSLADAQKVKDYEKVTNHDVKSVEYFLKDEFKNLGIEKLQEFIHFGLTSQDINNTAIPMMLRDAANEVVYPLLEEIIDTFDQLAKTWKNVPMLAFTHGQPASPTRLGKEFKVFAYRLQEQYNDLKALRYPAKFGGATGNFNAHQVAYPRVNWKKFADKFVDKTLGLTRSAYTTQIDNYDYLGSIFDNQKRINTILIDACRDIWQYISMGYFSQKINENEVGSSAMPHKVNPIDFENAEGNLGLANAMLEHLSAKLPISRLQRDLTDSTVLRNLGMPLGYMLVAYQSMRKGLAKLQLNDARIHQDLEENWVVVAEAIQTILRREGYPKPYEALKELTRTNGRIDQQTIHQFIDTLKVKHWVKDELKKITPFNYTGI